MSCNPSFGGIGKGHLVREIDALDGICARCCDLSGLQYKVLNKRKGPAVMGLRAQIDRNLYKNAVQEELQSLENLEICEDSVEDIIYCARKEQPKVKVVKGILTKSQREILSKCVVITTGTFLRGQINIGLDVRPAGRFEDEPANGLANSLETLGFKLSRLKTGTPPRIKADTINYDVLEKHYGDKKPVPFSFMNSKVWLDPLDQLPCHMTYTGKEVKEIVLDNLHLNRHVTEEITGSSTRPPRIFYSILGILGFLTSLNYLQALVIVLALNQKS